MAMQHLLIIVGRPLDQTPPSALLPSWPESLREALLGGRPSTSVLMTKLLGCLADAESLVLRFRIYIDIREAIVYINSTFRSLSLHQSEVIALKPPCVYQLQFSILEASELALSRPVNNGVSRGT